MLISLNSHVPRAPYLFMRTLTWSLGRGDSYGHKHVPQSFISPSDSIPSDSNSFAGSSFPSLPLRWFLLSGNPDMPGPPSCCVTILHHLSPVAGATGASRAISSIKKNTNALPGIFTRSHITWIARCSYLFFGLRAWQGFYKSHLFPSDTKNDPSVCDTKIELGIKFGNSDTEIQVTATQAKRELKSILGIDSLSLEGTFMHIGYVVQSKGEEITQSKEHKDSCHMGVALRLARETMTPHLCSWHPEQKHCKQTRGVTAPCLLSLLLTRVSYIHLGETGIRQWYL